LTVLPLGRPTPLLLAEREREHFADAVDPHAAATTTGRPNPPAVGGTIEETPILGGLHHGYRTAA